MTTTEPLITADYLLRAHDLGRCELVRGELIMMSPAGAEHGRIIYNFEARLGPMYCSGEFGSALGPKRASVSPTTRIPPGAGHSLCQHGPASSTAAQGVLSRAAGSGRRTGLARRS